MQMSEAEQKELQTARELLESPGIAAKITNVLGTPIEHGLTKLPENWQEKISRTTQIALERGLQLAIDTIDQQTEQSESKDMFHKIAAAATGGVGGAFGLAALAVELPLSTTIMLRSIADIARTEGEDISQPAGHLACLEVFALGGRSPDDDATETGYFAVRLALAKAVGDAAAHMAKKAAQKSTAPPLTKLIILIAERFGTQVAEKMAAQLIPAVGAAGGALINTIFMDHFQKMAKGHFIIRKLERIYGYENVKTAYDALS